MTKINDIIVQNGHFIGQLLRFTKYGGRKMKSPNKQTGIIALAALVIAMTTIVVVSCGGGTSSSPGDMYTVTYHANGESVTVPKPQKAGDGSIVYIATLQGYDPEAVGKFFIGWNTKSDGSGDFYCAGEPLKVEEDITLYAEWNEAESTLLSAPLVVTIPQEPGGWTDRWMTIVSFDKMFEGRVEQGVAYSLAYTFKSDVRLTDMFVNLVDNSGIDSDDPVILSNASEFTGMPYNAYTEIKGERPMLAANTIKTAPDESEEANSLRIWVRSNVQPTLTFTELALYKSEVVTLVNLTANGSSASLRTTQLILTFDKDVSGLTADDITILGIAGIQKGALSGSGKNYTLAINVLGAGFSGADDIWLSIRKAGYDFRNTAGSVKVYTGTNDDIPIQKVELLSVTANGSAEPIVKTTQLTIVLSFNVPGLNANDITLSGVPGLNKAGALSAPVSSGGRFTYTLPVSVTQNGGDLSVTINKAFHDIYPRLSVKVYRDYSGITYNGYLGKGYDIINGNYYIDEEVKDRYALNMPKLIAEGKFITNTYGNTSTFARYITGETLEQYSKEFSTKVKVGGGIGCFSASASFGYSGSHQAEYYESFASLFVEARREKFHIDMSDITIADLRNNYLNANFKNNFLMNTAVKPFDLFTQYGTHIFLTVYTGGRLDMSYVYHNHSQEDSSTIEAHVKASYGVVKGSVDSKVQEESRVFSQNSAEYVTSYGGTVKLGTTVAEAKSQYSAWATSIQNRKDLTIVRGGNLDNNTQMVPIWELIDYSWPGGYDRAVALINEANRLFGENGGKIFSGQKGRPNPPPVLYPQDFYIAAHSNSANAISSLVSKTFKNLVILQPNLNHGGGGGNYVYIGYTQTQLPASTVLRDIVAVKGGNNPETPKTINGQSYALFGFNDSVSANSGRKMPNSNNMIWAPNVWLYQNRSNTNKPPIKNVYIEYDGDLSGRNGTGWTRVKWSDGGDANMNLGGGKEIYLWVQR